jgi:hypothetical protein
MVEVKHEGHAAQAVQEEQVVEGEIIRDVVILNCTPDRRGTAMGACGSVNVAIGQWFDRQA